ncbi:MAG TPA: class I SAM-dependent methyltransferase [Streptosporangiaceae bacterium]
MTSQPGAESAHAERQASAEGPDPDDRTQADRYASGIFSHELPTELARLQLMERMLDPEEIKVLDGLSIQPTWHCLEIGAGAGSIARWLAERCPAGRVVATDIDPRHLDPSWFPHLEVVAHDVEQDDFPPESFDLVHARALFQHLAERDEILRKVVRWLKPGGWLAVGEADMFPVDSSPYPAVKLMWQAAEQLFVAQGSDPRWARRMPVVFAEAGLVELGMSVTLDILGGGGMTDEFWRFSFAQVKPFLIERGLVSEAVYAEAAALVNDPNFRDTMWAYVRTWGRRPA